MGSYGGSMCSDMTPPLRHKPNFVSDSSQGNAREVTAYLPTDVANASQTHMGLKHATKGKRGPTAIKDKNNLGPRSLAPTTINLTVLDHLLELYPDREVAEQLYTGFHFGFKSGYQGPQSPYQCKNLQSALQHPHIVTQKLREEISAGRVAGPFDQPPFDNFRCSPLGLVDKKADLTCSQQHITTENSRLIFHLSYPPNDSVNSHIPQEDKTVQYTPFDTVVQYIAHLHNLDTVMHAAKSDILNAFRLVRLHPSDFQNMGMCHLGKYYYDKCMPFGLSSAPSIFEKIATFLQWCVQHKAGLPGTFHLLDDFIFIGKNGEDTQILFQTFKALCSGLNIPLKASKTISPTPDTIQYLGIDISLK